MIETTETTLTLAIARIEDPDAPDAEILETMDKLDFILENAKRLKKAGEAAMTARVKAKGPISFGDWEYRMVRDRKVKIRKIRDVAEAVLQATEGDVDKFCELLTSDPFKQGAVKQLVGEAKWGELYEVIIDEFAEKKLAKVNRVFAKQK